MGHCIVKAVQDSHDDRYLVWSTIVDNFIFMGTAVEVARYWGEKTGASAPVAHLGGPTMREIDRMLARANKTGSSSEIGRWTWDEEEHLLTNVHDSDDFFLLKREHLADLWDLYRPWYQQGTDRVENPEPSYLHLLTPLPDEEEAVHG